MKLRTLLLKDAVHRWNNDRKSSNSSLSPVVTENEEIDLHYRNPYYTPDKKEQSERVQKLTLDLIPNLEDVVTIASPNNNKIKFLAESFERNRKVIYVLGVLANMLGLSILAFLLYNTTHFFATSIVYAVGVQSMIGISLIWSLIHLYRNSLIAGCVENYDYIYTDILCTSFWSILEDNKRINKGNSIKTPTSPLLEEIAARYDLEGKPNIRDAKIFLNYFKFYFITPIAANARNTNYVWFSILMASLYTFAAAVFVKDKDFMYLEHIFGFGILAFLQICSILFCIFTVFIHNIPTNKENALKANERMLHEIDANK